MKAKVRLIFRSVSEIIGESKVGLLVLTDSDEQRQIVVPCDQDMLEEFGKRMEEMPNTGKALPEVLWNVLQWQSGLRFEIHVDTLYEGSYQAMLSNIDTLDDVPISMPDAVLLSFVSKGEVPLLMDETLFRRQSTVYIPESLGVELPVNTISDEMLEEALNRAIEIENYEVASHLRDELMKRKGKGRRSEQPGEASENGER